MLLYDKINLLNERESLRRKIMKTYLLSFAICLGMLSVAEARTNHNSQVHNVQTHAGSAGVHEGDVTSRHPESQTQGYLGAVACPSALDQGPCT